MWRFKNRYYRRVCYLMGAPFSITAYGGEAACLQGMQEAFSEIARLEDILSRFKEDSPLSCLNRDPSGDFVIPNDLRRVLEEAFQYEKMSNGAFSPKAAGGFDLGAIGKGYAIDRAVEKLKGCGVTRFIISCGSTIYGSGTPIGKAFWPVTLRHPSEEKQETVVLMDQAISTSGNYERSMMRNGVWTHHIIDARSGLPVEGIASCSVIAKTATASDALSTAAFVLGESAGMALLEGREDVEGMIIGRDATSKTTGWSKSEIGPSRRSFLAMAAMLLIGLLLPFKAVGAVIYLTKEEGMRALWPKADRFDLNEIHLDDNQLQKTQALLGESFRKRDYLFYVGRAGEQIVGYALILEVIGKERPITFLIGIRPDGKIAGMEVLIYRESEGSSIRHGRFMRQFHNKGKEDPLQLGDDIQPISGATISSRAATYAARKALALFEVVYRS
jgi:thiamine biosynthesis lipoprotein ApbE/Na+-translocating ferredoxin:NAD+ oxidoreductase RnfG subunit